jgi:hypothetical protein
MHGVFKRGMRSTDVVHPSPNMKKFVDAHKIIGAIQGVKLAF